MDIKAATEQTVYYTLTLTVKRHVRQNDYNDPLEVSAAWMVGREGRCELEKEVLRALKSVDGDFDCEVMEAV